MKKKEGVRQRKETFLSMKNATAGITLVGLAVTVIILLILAGITINLTMSNNGIFEHAQIAREENKRSQIREYLDLKLLGEQSYHYEKTNKFIIDKTRENVIVNQNDLLKIGKQIDIKEVNVDVLQDGQEDAYFYVIVDKGIYKVSLSGTKYIGQQSDKEVELQKEDIKFTYEPSKWTTGKVKVGIVANRNIDGYNLEYKLEKGATWITYKNEIEVDKNQEIYARLAGIMGESSVATGNIENIDKLKPKEFTPEITATTNSITVVASTTDQEATKENGSSGIVPDQDYPETGYSFSKDGGLTWTAYQVEGSYTYNELTQKQEYDIKVKVRDRAGNETIASKKITTGEVPGLQTADVTFAYDPSKDTNTDVKVGITANKDITGYTLQYKTEKTGQAGEVSDWTNYIGTITLTRNQSIYARVVDSTGQSAQDKVATGNILNIDKLVPNSFTPTVTTTTNSITITASTTDAAKTSDNASTGIAGYSFSIDNGSTWTEYQTSGTYTYEKLPQKTEYTIKVKAKDKVGNETIASETGKTGEVTLATGNITFGTPTWDASTHKASVTISKNSGVSSSLSIQYQVNGYDDTKWITATKASNLNLNDTVYARLWDGTNGGSHTNLKITDKTLPQNATSTLSGTSTTTTSSVTATVTLVDNESGIDITNSKWAYTTSSSAIGTTASNYPNAFSSNPQTITLKGTSPGTYYLHVLAQDKAGNKKETIFTGITVSQKATGISLNKTSTTIYTGKTETLTATVTPSNASNKNVTWKSSNTGVATVSGGKITPVAPGTTTITATTSDGSNKSASCTVTVKQYVTGISLNKTSTTIYVGNTETLTATVTPTNASNKNVNWSSTNTSVATVSGGKITAVAVGTATIKATAADGSGKSASCTVTVKEHIAVNTSWEFNYIGSTETFTVPETGVYKVELYGAQGGGTKGYKGTYIYGNISLNSGEVITVNVGGQDGYNGGGAGQTAKVTKSFACKLCGKKYSVSVTNGTGNGGGATSMQRADGVFAIAGGGAGYGKYTYGYYEHNRDTGNCFYTVTSATDLTTNGGSVQANGLAPIPIKVSTGADATVSTQQTKYYDDNGSETGRNQYADTCRVTVTGGGGGGHAGGKPGRSGDSYTDALSDATTTVNNNSGHGKAVITFVSY